MIIAKNILEQYFLVQNNISKAIIKFRKVKLI